jgi:hypothetical protein
MRRSEGLPLDSLSEGAELLVLSSDGKVISEHQTPADAMQAFARYVLESGEEGLICKRTSDGWKIF